MPELNLLAAQVGKILTQRRWQLVTAESCTGGFLAKIITDIPNASSWFDRGFITYSYRSKQDMLGVRAKTLNDFGAVSQPVVEEMAQGALEHSLAQVSVAITGIAGPTGGTPEKPVGTVWIAWGRHSIPVVTLNYCFAGDRASVRTQSVIMALTQLKDLLENEVGWH